MPNSDIAYPEVAGLYPVSPLGESQRGIPTGRDVEWEPLVDYRRNGVSETTIHGAVAWAHGGSSIHSFGGNVLCYGRSMMKPLMMKPLAEALSSALDGPSRAIAVSSHNGDASHVAAAQAILPEEDQGLMQAPLDVPLIQFGRQVRRPRRWFHCCSGEHAAVLRACQELGWPQAGYMLPSHPFFEAYLQTLRRYLGDDWSPLKVARDGCGMPTVSNTVTELAVLFAGLADGKEEDWIWDAMVDYPDIVGGFNRLDSTVLKACEGRVLAKEGADGLLGLAILHDDFPKGLGIVIKVAHGWDPRAIWYVARGILGVLGFDLRNPYPLEKQKAFLVPGIVPESYLESLEKIPTWDAWDPDKDRWYGDLGEEV